MGKIEHGWSPQLDACVPVSARLSCGDGTDRIIARRERAILRTMTMLLEEAVDIVRTLPEDEQDRAAQALLALAEERAGDSWA
jgi:hypothetical protein